MNEFDDMTARRDCGSSEAELFAWLDGDLDAASRRVFETHLEACAVCRREAEAYRSLELSLNSLSLLDPRPAFNEEVLSRIPALHAPVHVHRPRPLDAVARRFAVLPAPVRAYLGAAALLGVAVLTFLTLYAQSVGGPEKLANRTIVQAAQAGAGIVTDGARQVVAAVTVSDVLMDVAVRFRPVAHSLSLAFNAVGSEFWFLTMLVSLLVLLGAVRLASGPAVGGGGHRVSLFC